MEKYCFGLYSHFQLMFHFLIFLLKSPVCLSYYSGNKYQFACVGQDVEIAVDSRARVVTFDRTEWQGPRKVLLENTIVKDSRYEWKRDMTLVIRNVTYEDQGLYSIKSPLTGFTFETVRLTVSECVKRFIRNYGETFKVEIPEEADALEFQGSSHLLSSSAPASLSLPEPVILWERAQSEVGKGTMRDRYWVIDSVAPTDQGNYTIKDSNGTAVSRISLTVKAHMFNLTLYSKESLFIFMWVPVAWARLHFSPAPHAFVGPSLLLQDGEIMQYETRYRGRLSLHRNDTGMYMVITALSRSDDGTYKLLDRDSNLVSSTVITVKERHAKWRAVIKSISVPSGMFAALAGFILFMKRYPRCSINNIVSGLRDRQNAIAINSPAVLVQQDSREQDSACVSSSVYDSGSPVNSKLSPSHSGHSSAITNLKQYSNPPIQEPVIENEARKNLTANLVNKAYNSEHKMSTLDPGDSNYLTPSDLCIQYDIGRMGKVDQKEGETDHYISTLPLNADTSLMCSIYSSEKLDFL